MASVNIPTQSHTALQYIQFLCTAHLYNCCIQELYVSPLSSLYSPPHTPLSVIQPYVQFLCTAHLYSCCIEELYKGAVCKPLSSLFSPPHTPTLCHTALHTVLVYSSFIQLLYKVYVCKPPLLSIPLLKPPLSVIQPYIQLLCTAHLYSCCIEEL